SREGELGVKYDVTLYLPAVEKLQAGVSLRRLSADYDAASPFGSDSPYYPEADQNPFALRERRAAAQVGGYLQASRRIAGRLNLTAGLRGDRFDYLDASRLSPRAGASVDLSPRMALQMSAGRYYQQPFFLFLAAFPQNRTLEPFAADHLVGGWSFT